MKISYRPCWFYIKKLCAFKIPPKKHETSNFLQLKITGLLPLLRHFGGCLSRDKPIHFFQGLETCCKVFFSGSVIVSLAFFPLTCVTYLIQVISWNYLLPMVLQWEMDLQRRRQWIWMKTARLPSAFSPPPKSKQLKLSKKNTLQTWKVPFFFRY